MTARRAIRPITGLPPLHRVTQRTFRRVIRRLDPFDTHERPQRWFYLQQLPAGGGGLGAGAHAPFCQQFAEARTYLPDVGAETGPTERAIPYSIPPGKHR